MRNWWLSDEPLALFDDEMNVVAFIAFEKLDRVRVAVMSGASPLAALAARM